MAVKRWNGTSWEIYAGSDLAPVKVTDGRVGKTTFIGATTPTGMVDGDIWIDQDTATNAVVPTALLAKGDIFVATGNGAYTRLAAGNNGESLYADSSSSTGLRWQGLQSAGKNYFINGSMDFWQRGTTFTTPAGAYTADRFKATVNGAGTYVISRQASGLSETQYCLRFQRSAGQTYTFGSFVGYAWETEAMQSLQGKTVTYSFYARVGANWSPIGGVGVQLQQGTGSGTHAFSALTGETSAFAGTATGLTTSWQRFSFTGALSPTATELRTNLSFSPVGTAGANDYIELTGFQLELGSVATPLSRSGGTFAGELAACQRYFQKIGTDGNAYQLFTVCTAESSTTAWGPVYLPVKMRVTPSGSFSSTQPWNLQGQNISNANMYFDPNQTGPNIVTIGTLSATGMTAFQSRYLRSNNDTTTCLNLSAEL